MNITKFLLLSLLTLLPNQARATDGDVYYLGANYGNTVYRGGNAPTSIFEAGQEFKDDDNIFSLYVGYEINKLLSLELKYSDYGDASDTFKISPDLVFCCAPNTTETVDANGISFSALLGHEFKNGLNIFGLLGFSYFDIDRSGSGGFLSGSESLTNSSSGSDNGFVFGAGIKYSISEKILLRFQWERNRIEDLEIDASTFGFDIKL